MQLKAGAGARARSFFFRFARSVRAVLPQWIVARLVVLGTLALANLIVARVHPGRPGVVSRAHAGLLGWDAGWYETIARVGYGPLGHQSLRFFPLVPLLTRMLGYLFIGDGSAVVVVSNVSTLLGTALLFVLVRRETGDERLASRTVWLFSLLPPAFVLVMGYAEGTLLFFTAGCFVALRRGAGKAEWSGPTGPSWIVVALCGFGAALTRPLGGLLMLAIGVEVLRWWGRSDMKQRVLMGTALLSPALGTAAFLAWVGIVFGNPLIPVTVQTQSGHHGGLTNPLQTVFNDARAVLGHHFGTALHVPWVVLVVVLIVVTWRRWPATYGAFATGVVAVALSGTNLDSFERYALSAFPLVMTGALLTSGEKMEKTVLALATAGMVAYALLAFLNLSVP